ncbi:MAG: PDZ domain-containing protein [Aggregatilineaceae bacterium]
MWSKRILIVSLVAVVAVSGLGLLTTRAAHQFPAAMALAQNDGKAWLGVSVADTKDGVTVRTVVPGSPADDAGLRPGDVIEAVDGTAIETAQQMVEIIGGHVPGDEIVLTVSWRGDSRKVKVSVTLGTQPAQPKVWSGPGYMMRGMLNVLGLELEVTEEGLRVESIAADSPLAEAGFQQGDVITAINGEAIDTSMPRLMLRLFRFDKPLVFTVQRNGEEIEITVDPAALAGRYLPKITPVQPTQLGVSFQTIDADLAAEKELPVTSGALIVEVFEDTPAARAGLQAGDIVLAVDGEAVDEEHTLRDRLVAYEEGDVVTLTVRRGEEELSLEVTLGPRGPEVLGWTIPSESWPGWEYGGRWNMPDLRGFRFDFGGDLKGFLDRHPNLRDLLPGDGNDLFDFGQFPWDEVQPAIPGQAA